MEKPLGPAAVFAILQRVDLRRWGARAAVLCYVAELTAAQDPNDWARGSRAYVRAGTGLAESTIKTALDGLVADRVLERHAAAGSRGHAYRIQPDVRAWRGVPWRPGTDQVAVAYTAEVVNGELRYVGPPRVVDRSIAGRQIQIADRSLPGQQRNGSCAMHNRSATGPPLTDAWPVDNGNGPARSMTGQQIGPPGGALPSSFDSEEEEEAKRLVDAIQKATGNPVWGSLIDRVAAVLRRGLALGEAMAYVQANGSRWTPPQLVRQLEAQARGVPPPPAPEATPPAAAAPPPDPPAPFLAPERDVTPAPAPAALLGRFGLHTNGRTAD